MKKNSFFKSTQYKDIFFGNSKQKDENFGMVEYQQPFNAEKYFFEALLGYLQSVYNVNLLVTVGVGVSQGGAKLSKGLQRTEDAGLDTRTPHAVLLSRRQMSQFCTAAQQPPLCCRPLTLQKNCPSFPLQLHYIAQWYIIIVTNLNDI